MNDASVSLDSNTLSIHALTVEVKALRVGKRQD